MMWWLKIRRALTILPAGIFCFVVLSFIVRETTVLLPSILGGPRIALSLFVPIPLLCSLMMCLESRIPAPEASSTRRIALMDASLIVLCAGFGLIIGAVESLLLGMPIIMAAGRNVCFLAGVMLIGRSIMGKSAVMLPVLWVVLVAVVGFGEMNEPYFWTIIPSPAVSPFSALAAVAVFLIGLMVNMRNSRDLS